MNDAPIDRRLPLVDLHRHLDGNLRLQTELAIGRELGLPLPAEKDDLLAHAAARG